jgi:hypothetical protein
LIYSRFTGAEQPPAVGHSISNVRLLSSPKALTVHLLELSPGAVGQCVSPLNK